MSAILENPSHYNTNHMPEITPPSPSPAYLHIRRFLGRAALIAGILTAPTAVFQGNDTIFPSHPAHAATEFVNDYPNLDAKEYNLSNYDWWVDEDGDGTADMNPDDTTDDEAMSPRGYEYRDCTDGASYWANKYTGYDPRKWGYAKNWHTAAAAAGRTVKGAAIMILSQGI